ncbi:MAG: hypothetical protein ACYDAO_08695 [Thermoplasmataceae archaeon]
MLIQDWDNSSFLTCSLIVKGEENPFKFAHSANIFSMGQLDMDKGLIRLPIKKRENVERDFHIFINASASIETENYWIMEFSNENLVKPLIRAMNIQSVYFNSINLIGGDFHIGFSFHKSKYREVSSFILELVTSRDDVSIEYVGNTKTLLETMQVLNAKENLYMISIVSTPPENVLTPNDNSVTTRWIRLIKSVSSEKVNGIFRVTEGNITDSEDYFPISLPEKLYEAATENVIIRDIEYESRKSGLDPALRLNMYDGKKLYAEYFISKYDLKILLKIMSEVMQKHEDWNVIFGDIIPLSKLKE